MFYLVFSYIDIHSVASRRPAETSTRIDQYIGVVQSVIVCIYDFIFIDENGQSV